MLRIFIKIEKIEIIKTNKGGERQREIYLKRGRESGEVCVHVGGGGGGV